jgi:uncharacterized membrane protein YeaQ/YmgE (transglycosylase-associated protein family)
MLQGLVESGRIVDLILGLVGIEVLVVSLLARGRRNGFGPVDALVNALAGIGILLALRSALTGAAWTSVAGWLAGALVAHLADVARRWRTDR